MGYEFCLKRTTISIHLLNFCFSYKMQLTTSTPDRAMEKKPGCLGYIGDDTTQLCGDFSKPLQGSFLPTSTVESRMCFFRGSIGIPKKNITNMVCFFVHGEFFTGNKYHDISWIDTAYTFLGGVFNILYFHPYLRE